MTINILFFTITISKRKITLEEARHRHACVVGRRVWHPR
ncbi:MAG: YrzI family small protein [Bacillus sp. (in: Bacteria)]|nr:YrzI family small protein [Bacillus sp. (in: firmicutes)]